MYRWFIALRYLTSRFVTFAALLIVAASVAILIIVLSVMEGFRMDLEARIRGTSADLRVESRSFVGLRDPEGTAAAIRKVPGVLGASPYVETLVMHQPDGDTESYPFHLHAIDLAEEARVGAIDRYLALARDRSEGNRRANIIERHGVRTGPIAQQPPSIARLLSPEWLGAGLWQATGEARPPKPLPPILVGWETLPSFGFTLGRTVKLTSYSPVSGRAVAAEFTVAGVYISRDYLFDSRTILLPIEEGVKFLELGVEAEGAEGAVPGTKEGSAGPHYLASGVRVVLGEGEDPSAAKARVEEAVRGQAFLRVRTWREEKASLLRSVKIEKAVVGIILSVLIVFAGFMIFIVLTVQVVEKTRDLGILQSLGSTSGGIARIFLTIGAIVCSVGTVMGTIYGVAFSLSINTILRWLYLLVGFELFPKDLYYVDSIPVRLAPMDLIIVILPTVLASLIASLIPALRAARKDPVVALRYE